MSRTIQMFAALVGVLLISAVSAGSALAVTVTVSCSPPGQLRSVDGGLACPVPNTVTFTADQSVDWKVIRGEDYAATSPLATGSGPSITFNAGPELANQDLVGRAYIGGSQQNAAGVYLVDSADQPAPITMLSPASFATPATIALQSPKPNLKVRLRGVQDLPAAPCFSAVPAGTRCFFVGGEVGVGSYWLDATASSNTQSGQTDLKSFPVTVTGSSGPAFTRPVATVAFRRTGSACQAKAAVTLRARESFVLQGEYRLEAKVGGRWKRLLAQKQRLNGTAAAGDQVLASTASLKGKAVERAIASRAKARLRVSFVVLSGGVAKARSKDITKSVNLRSCR